MKPKLLFAKKDMKKAKVIRYVSIGFGVMVCLGTIPLTTFLTTIASKLIAFCTSATIGLVAGAMLEERLALKYFD